MSEDLIHIIERIKKIKGLHTLTEVAKELRMSKENLNGYKRRGSIPRKAISDFCKRNNILIDDILTGEGEKYIRKTPTADFRETVCIPLIGTVPAGFPEMPPEEDQIIDYLCLPDAPRTSFAIIVKGESMSPTVRDGDYALFIKAGKFDVKNGDLIIARNEWNELLLKRYRSKDNRILLTSDNPEYKPITPNEHYKIVGKVIRIVRDIKF